MSRNRGSISHAVGALFITLRFLPQIKSDQDLLRIFRFVSFDSELDSTGRKSDVWCPSPGIVTANDAFYSGGAKKLLGPLCVSTGRKPSEPLNRNQAGVHSIATTRLMTEINRSQLPGCRAVASCWVTHLLGPECSGSQRLAGKRSSTLASQGQLYFQRSPAFADGPVGAEPHQRPRVL